MEITVNTCIISIKMSITIQTMQWKKWKFKQNLIYFQTSVAQVRKGSYTIKQDPLQGYYIKKFTINSQLIHTSYHS